MNNSIDLKELVLDAVLIFHSGSPWDDNKTLRWQNICVAVLGPATADYDGHVGHDATTRKLCDLIRKVRE